MLTGLTTPGAKSSEFLVTVLNVIAQLILAFTDTITSGTATKLGALGTVAYILSRGLAKYEAKPLPPAPVAPTTVTKSTP
jgi:hypothetical protein